MLLGTDPSQDSTGTNAFINALVANNVRWYINGHDHMHDHSRIYTTDLANYVTELTCASDSNKFYTPAATANDVTYNVPAFGHTRQVEISQDLYYIPYYIVTVDGPKVQIDYYAVNSGSVGGANITTTPTLTGNWAKRETFGYSLNGHEFMVPQGSPYTTVQDSIAKGTDSYGSTFYGTSAAILSGTNGSTVKDKSSRKLTKALNTGWAPLISGSTISDIFTLWGMNDVAAATSDTYSVSVSYNPATVTTATINAGHPAYLGYTHEGRKRQHHRLGQVCEREVCPRPVECEIPPGLLRPRHEYEHRLGSRQQRRRFCRYSTVTWRKGEITCLRE